jgi:serine/threonine-protein kinase
MNVPSSVDRAELPTQPPAVPGTFSLGGLAALLHEELHRRWVKGERPAVEEYLQRYPQLHANRDLVLALVLQEVLLRRQGGEQPSVEELAARFPDLAEPLRGALRMERFLLSALPAAADIRPLAFAPATVAPQQPQEATGPHANTGEAPPTRLDVAASRDTPGPLVCVPGYQVQGVLGKGGMGIVYKAEQTKLRRLVALKMILHAEYAGVDERRRFQAEAEAVAQLQHPNVVQVHEVGEHNGLPYFSLEFCSGGSLEKQLDGTPWEPKRAAALVQTLAQAMHAAHQAGLVHRDLKPGNVLLTADGTPKITDFGLVKRLDVQGNTQTGAVVGTPSYVAPEQACGKHKEVGPAADVYALGAILYELLTGRPPFQAATVMDTLLQVMEQEPVSPRSLNGQIDRDLETVCLKCLEKSPAKRYQSARELADDLDRYLAGEPTVARPTAEHDLWVKWTLRKPQLAGAAFVLMLAGGIVLATAALNPAGVARAFQGAWLDDPLGLLLAALAGTVTLVFMAVQGVKSYREGVGLLFGLLRVAWVIPASVVGVAASGIGMKVLGNLIGLGPGTSVKLVGLLAATGLAAYARWGRQNVRAGAASRRLGRLMAVVTYGSVALVLVSLTIAWLVKAFR